MEQQIYDLLYDIIHQAHIDLVSINIVKQGKETILEVVIDKDGGVDLDDCVKITNLINPVLDEHDLMKESYILEVMSKGVA